MGNKASQRSNLLVEKVYQTSEYKAGWILDWYNEEAFNYGVTCDGGSVTPNSNVNVTCDSGRVTRSNGNVTCDVIKCFRILCDGRRIGVPGMEKILSVTTPIQLLAKVCE
jgi:hypothetical protein